ncbi:Glucoside xylosyltransferase 1 [Porphyridium purpureum]|uniref:UDP-D-xylose:beta-D-glucoside alpha-1,3-D-xylosyltransferase n=1 Tax=Porphyridium purpureum TaxID=35688 RepID=A0A5J4Z528_PORPP|nr:Glucoside xylosyltransferase 1 [Porphyridium purpureum]|eukprot:POR2297..scf295_1
MCAQRNVLRQESEPPENADVRNILAPPVGMRWPILISLAFSGLALLFALFMFVSVPAAPISRGLILEPETPTDGANTLMDALKLEATAKEPRAATVRVGVRPTVEFRPEPYNSSKPAVAWIWQRNVMDPADHIHIATAVCKPGYVWSYAEGMIKSMFLFARQQDTHYVLHMFVLEQDVNASVAHFAPFADALLSTDTLAALSFELVVHPSYADKVTHYFKPCAGQRLFITESLPEVNRLIYLDADIMFLDDVWQLASLFKLWRSPDMLLGMSAEKSDYEIRGLNYLNDGVALMQLDALRKFDLISFARKLYESGETFRYFDQDILNRACATYETDLETRTKRCFNLPCNWNFRTDFIIEWGCSYNMQPGGKISILHGNRNLFREEKIHGARPMKTAPFIRMAKTLWESLMTCSVHTCLSAMIAVVEHAVQSNPRCDVFKIFKSNMNSELAMGTWEQDLKSPIFNKENWPYFYKLTNGTCTNARLLKQLLAHLNTSAF